MTRKDQRIGRGTRESNKEKNIYWKKKRMFTVGMKLRFFIVSKDIDCKQRVNRQALQFWRGPKKGKKVL